MRLRVCFYAITVAFHSFRDSYGLLLHFVYRYPGQLFVYYGDRSQSSSILSETFKDEIMSNKYTIDFDLEIRNAN